MRLIHIPTMKLEQFYGDDIPRYYILSHTWGDGEITYDDFAKGNYGYRPSFYKLNGFLRKITEGKRGVNYAWIDTCCINKDSSAELTEAINSMYDWYRKAEVCIVYLSDVVIGSMPLNNDSIAKSRWFTRAWTLQELLAPQILWFFDRNWQLVSRFFRFTTHQQTSGFGQALETATGIPAQYLLSSSDLNLASIAQRMSWAANRQATRLEDIAYSLMGIFGINIPLLYGEGENAFLRLQEEIIRNSSDESIFAWGLEQPCNQYSRLNNSILARSPADFANCGRVRKFLFPAEDPRRYSMTNMGLECSFRSFSRNNGSADYPFILAQLNCGIQHATIGKFLAIAIPLCRGSSRIEYNRYYSAKVTAVSPESFYSKPGERRYISRDVPRVYIFSNLGLRVTDNLHPKVYNNYPPQWVLEPWNEKWFFRRVEDGLPEKTNENIIVHLGMFSGLSIALWLDINVTDERVGGDLEISVNSLGMVRILETSFAELMIEADSKQIAGTREWARSIETEHGTLMLDLDSGDEDDLDSGLRFGGLRFGGPSLSLSLFPRRGGFGISNQP